jgi:hypothetical protein
VVGAFEGARYLETGIYRPWLLCEMRALGQQFCPVCREAHVKEFCDRVDLVDQVVPWPGTAIDIDQSGFTFAVDPLPFSDLDYEWSLDGVPVAGETGSSFTLTPAHMVDRTQTLALAITFNTELVRKYDINTGYSWPVTSLLPLCCTGIVGDVNFDGGYEPTIGDISTLIDNVFLDGPPLECVEEADANQSGGVDPTEDDLTIGDISTLIDYLFIDNNPLLECL